MDADNLGPIAAYPSPPNNHSSPSHRDNTTRSSTLSPYEQVNTMASSMSPNQSSQSSFGGGPASHDKSPLSSLNLNFLKNLTEKRTTRDGQPPKRRGPKPDSKPALTRRQELNRQAQRTHRERKELYIKALEDEVLRLKEIYSNISQDKERLAEENRQLKALLSQNGLAVSTGTGSAVDDSMSNPSIGYTSSASVTGSYAPASSSNTSAYTPPPLSVTPVTNVAGGTRGGTSAGGLSPHGVSPHAHSHGHSSGSHHHHSGQGQQQLGTAAAGGTGSGRNPNLDYDQSGIDFVLTYENPSKAYLSPPHQ